MRACYAMQVFKEGIQRYELGPDLFFLQGPLLMSLVLLSIHLARRCLETHFMMKYPSGSNMHVVAYIFGLV